MRNRDPFGVDTEGYGDLEGPGQDNIAQAMAVLAAAHPGAIEAYKRTVEANQGHPPLPQPMRYGTRQRWPQIPVWPTTVIKPDPKIYPATTTRLRTLHLSSTEDTAISGQIQFPEWLTIYAISAEVHVTQVDPSVRRLEPAQRRRRVHPGLRRHAGADGAAVQHLRHR